MNNRRNDFLTRGRLAVACTALSLALGVSCSERQDVYLEGEAGQSSGFVPQDNDASSDTGASVPESTAMCPLTTCSFPYATCPSSEFPCGTNLRNDNDNCGGCGIRCGGANPAISSQWTCIEGQCTFGCMPTYANCDDDVSNGCETRVLFDVNNCGACGHQCGPGEICWNMGCHDLCAVNGFPDRCGDTCVDLQKSDNACGDCSTRCPTAEPTKPALPADMYYGCANATCGQPKCIDETMADCNGKTSDGCETPIHTNENCRGCGDKCLPGKDCRKSPATGWGCLCEDGLVWCNGDCRDIQDDPSNCGGCARICPGENAPNFITSCSKGTCGGKCSDGYLDCDGQLSNGCEVDVRIDNRNCGACGQACSPGQVCSRGECQLTACDAGVSGGPTK